MNTAGERRNRIVVPETASEVSSLDSSCIPSQLHGCVRYGMYDVHSGHRGAMGRVFWRAASRMTVRASGQKR